MTRPRVPFSALAIGDLFYSNGTVWRKKSTRTAAVLNTPRWFYFTATHLVERW